MHQLIIIIPSGINLSTFDEGWPQFLAAAEKMPGLLKESVTRLDQSLYGTPSIQRIYSFDFQDLESLRQALVSDPGEKAGEILHQITGGRVSIYTGIQQADSLENIHSKPCPQPNP